jgi:hypothetical protein
VATTLLNAQELRSSCILHDFFSYHSGFRYEIQPTGQKKNKEEEDVKEE